MARLRVPALVVVAAVAIGFLMGSLMSGQVQASSALTSKLHVFNEILTYADKFYVEEVDAVELVEGAIAGLLEELDPHSTYVRPKDYEQMTERNTGEYEGIGISFEIREGWITVITAIEGGPSAHLGIRPGDRIVGIEGESAKDLVSEEVIAKLKGPKGTDVDITVERPGANNTFDLTIRRDRIPIYSVPYHFMLDDETGYIRATRFSATTSEELEAALRDLESQGMQKLVFDLRNNSGGYLNQAIEVSDRFIKGDEVIVYTKGRIKGSSQYYYSSNGVTRSKFPLICLVNHGSASASEIVSGAIQDHDRGLVIGQTTFGKGLVQRQYSLRDGSALLLTVARYYTPSGRLIQRSYEDRDEYLEYFRRLNDGDIDESEIEARPEFKTLNEERTVYGGGGITPDILVEDVYDPNEIQTKLEQLRVFFEFANDYAARNLDKATLVQRDFVTNFELPEAGFKEFKKFIKDVEGAEELTQEDIENEREYIKLGVKRELAGNLWGLNARYQVFVQEDPQLQKALTHFNEAENMARLYAKVGIDE
ncbi:MAG: S41 family peptidase [Candidatus Eisenbacteria bacterium]|uniref:S41 family peptidase n=1 Tax=Eiseniibacteriota bacterium TaxID=2212470 RepID=A0A7Y2E8X2_UNCEI|nr:S41 family peptidase [Candidatus Eisenbacteria bacterium]